ncbi:hypothetical protein [Saccharibacillus sp. O23]|uniref:hypothetical protein n=1 Tax=Saccharibacillus sp. O23 TaxID=2009338 RepID=UPI00117B58C1|nr:hypothetical protein [Saccharibacillus sp. O23]
MLKKNDPAWSKLTTAYGEGAEALELLLRLEPDAADEELRRELIELLLHQGTIYTATLAAMPYLANMAEQTEDDEALIDLYISGGLMKAGREGEEGEPVERSGEFRRDRQGELDEATVRSIADGYRDGIARLAALHERATRRAAEAANAGEEEDADTVYLLAARAAYAGHLNAARLLFDFSGGDEYVGACPSCETDWYIWPREEGSDAREEYGALIVYPYDPVLEEAGDRVAAEIRPARRDALRPELRELASEARRLGARGLADAIPSLDGHAHCPVCGQEESVWTVLTGW